MTPPALWDPIVLGNAVSMCKPVRNSNGIGDFENVDSNSHSNFRCDEDEGYFDLQYPGISDLSLTPYNDKISSYRCA